MRKLTGFLLVTISFPTIIFASDYSQMLQQNSQGSQSQQGDSYQKIFQEDKQPQVQNQLSNEYHTDAYPKGNMIDPNAS